MRQNLLHQHVGLLDTKPDYSHQQAHHYLWSITGRWLETLQASVLDLPYLITDEAPAHHVATQLSQGVGRDRLALGGAQAVKAFSGLLQLGIEAADAEPDQRCFHSVDDPTLLSDEALVLAVGPLGIFVLGVGIATFLQRSRSPRSQPRKERLSSSVSSRSVLARLCSRYTATLDA